MGKSLVTTKDRCPKEDGLYIFTDLNGDEHLVEVFTAKQDKSLRYGGYIEPERPGFQGMFKLDRFVGTWKKVDKDGTKIKKPSK